MQNLNQLKQLAKNALANWPMGAEHVDLIKFRENAVFKVTTADGEQYALRIHRPGYHPTAAIASELDWMAALATSGVPVPQVVPTQSGELFVTATSDDMAQPRLIDLFEWVEGETVRTRLEREKRAGNLAGIMRLFRQVGEMMAQLHNHAADWRPPAEFTRHAWDLDGLVGERPFWGRFWELKMLSAEQKSLMTATRHRLKKELTAYGQSATTYGLIHADFNFDNILIDEDEMHLIDFDDAGYGWHLFDISIMLNHVDQEPFEQRAADALIDGYRQHRPLSAADLAHLPLFMLARSCTYLGWIRDRQEVAEVRQRGPILIERACRLARAYVGS